MERREWMRLLGVLAAARPELFAQQRAAQKQGPQTPQVATREMLATALKLMGLEFPEAQLDMMLRNVNQALAGYGRLRRLDIPLDTEPAFSFHPWAPLGAPPAAGTARFAATKTAAPKSRNWKSLEDLAFRPVTELAALVKARQVTSTELTRMYLERLKKYGPKLLCVITLTEELAIEQAKRADDEIRRGKYRGPLHGIPWGAKDLFATKGIRTTWGAEPFREQMIDYDATAVTRLHEAGAVLVAKLSMGALAQGGLWFEGMTKTPWNLERTSSGSSAGSASATAAGLVGFSLGTETLGSIVSPSIACGVTGLRPTYGRVSRYGAMGLSWTMDKIGPICRAVEDCALVLRAIYGPDGKDRTVTQAPFHWEAARPLAGLRIGVLQEAFDSQQSEPKKIHEEALAALKKAGVNMKPVKYAEDEAATLRFLLTAEAAAAFDDITRDGKVNQLRGQAANDWPNTFRSARLTPAVEYIRAQRGRARLMERFEKWISEWDVIVTPPFTLLTTTNLTGHPQVVVPCGFLKDAPQGLGFVGRLYDEGAPLRVALAYQQATEWHRKTPPALA